MDSSIIGNIPAAGDTNKLITMFEELSDSSQLKPECE